MGINTHPEKEDSVMGLGKIIEAGAITWFLGGGVVLFIVVLLLLKAC
jgi:hypothetical protein